MTERMDKQTVEEELDEKKKAELRLIAELTLDATLAAEEKISKLAAKPPKPSL